MRRTPARLLLAGTVVAAGAGVVTGTALPWLTTFAGLQGYAAVDGLYGQVLAGLGGAVVLGGLVLAWRETAVGRWALLGAALAAALLSGWMLAQSEALYATLAADVFTVAGRGPGGFVALACALLATGLALVPVPHGADVVADGGQPAASPGGGSAGPAAAGGPADPAVRAA